MSTKRSANLTPEEQKLQFERQKLALDVLLKRRELSREPASPIREILTNPIALAVVGGVITLMTQIVTSSLNTTFQRDAEMQRGALTRDAEERQAKAAQDAASRSLQADLIKKFADAPDLATARGNLEFLVDAGLLPDFEKRIRIYLENNPKAGPFLGQLTPGIVGSDDRIGLSALSRLERENFLGIGRVIKSKSDSCTGVLVAHGILVTAQHCLSRGTSAQFSPYRSDGSEGPLFEISTEVVVTVSIDTMDVWGVSLARVKGLPNDQKFIPLISEKPYVEESVELAGFVFDRNEFIVSQCQTIRLDTKEVSHLCDSGAGSSGGPLLAEVATGRPTVVGIHLGNGEQGKRAVRGDLIRQDAAVLAEFGELPVN